MPSPDERSVGDDDGDDFALPEGSVPGRTALPEPQIGSAKVPPRGGGVSSHELAYEFFLDERRHIPKDGHQRATRGPTRQGRAPTLVDGGWPPLVLLSPNIFYIF